MSRLQWFCKSMPSDAASVASRMRTGESCGDAWNAALIGSRSSWESPPWSRPRRSLQKPWLARICCIHWCVGREALVGEGVAGEDLLHPLVRGAVLGEQDHPAVVPLAVGLEIDREPVEDGLGL